MCIIMSWVILAVADFSEKKISREGKKREGEIHKFFLTKEQHEFLTVNHQAENAQVNCDLYIVFSEPQEYFSQHFVLGESLARNWGNLGATSSNLGRQFVTYWCQSVHPLLHYLCSVGMERTAAWSNDHREDLIPSVSPCQHTAISVHF